MSQDKPAPNSLAARQAKQLAMAIPIQDAIVLSCRLKSGLFESQIEVPLYATREEMDRFVMAWLGMMDQGIKIGQQVQP